MTQVMKLYEIGSKYDNEYDKITRQLIENGGELTEELAYVLDHVGDDFEAKVERVALHIKNIGVSADRYEAEAGAVMKEVDRLRGHARVLKASAKNLERYLKRNMEPRGFKKIQGELITVSIQKSPPRVNPVPDEFLPTLGERWVSTTYKLNKTEIVAAHKAGESLPEGVSVEQGTHLRIR